MSAEMAQGIIPNYVRLFAKSIFVDYRIYQSLNRFIFRPILFGDIFRVIDYSAW